MKVLIQPRFNKKFWKIGLSAVIYLTASHTLFATDNPNLKRDVSTDSILSSQTHEEDFNWVLVMEHEAYLGDNITHDTHSQANDQSNCGDSPRDLNESPTSSLCLSRSSSLDVPLCESDRDGHMFNSTPFSHLNEEMCDIPETANSIINNNHYIIPSAQGVSQGVSHIVSQGVYHDARPPFRVPFDCHGVALTPSLRQFNQMRQDQLLQQNTKSLDELESQSPKPKSQQTSPLDITSHSSVDNSSHPLLRPSSPNTAANFYRNNITLGEDGIPRFSELPNSQTPSNHIPGRQFFNSISKSPSFWAVSLTAGALLLFSTKEN